MTPPDTLTLCPRGCGHVLWEPEGATPYCLHHGPIDEPGVVYVRAVPDDTDCNQRQPGESLMPWGRVDDSLLTHRKIIGIDLRALGLWTLCLAYSAEHLTDGFIPYHVVLHLSTAPAQVTKRLASMLVDRGLWERVDGGFQMHNYLKWNPSKAQVETRRQSDKARQERSRERHSGRYGADPTNAVTHAVTHALVTPASHVHPIPSHPSTTEQEVGGSAVRGVAGARAGSVSEPPGAAIPGADNGPSAPDHGAKQDAALRMLSAATGVSVEQLRTQALERRARELAEGRQP